jgi:hypothetical protein
MARKQNRPENSLLDPSLEPVEHLSSSLQRKLLKRVQKQRKHFRSSGKAYPLVTALSMSESTERSLLYTLLLVVGELD